MKVLKVIGAIVFFIVSYLIVIIFFPVLKVKKQPIKGKNKKSPVPPGRDEVTITVGGQKVSGWFYLPGEPGNSGKSGEIENKVPCVVLSHGFGGTKDMGLEKYALEFNKAGYAALAIDYRHFGDSQGEPRQDYSIQKQLEDVRGAITYARGRDEIDPENIFIWGTSASGTYGVMIAAEDKRIAGIIGQCPSLDHEADGNLFIKRDGIFWFLSLIVHAQRDKGRSRFGLSEHTFPIVGKPGTTAMFIGPDMYEGYKKLAENSVTFKNEVCARLLLMAHGPDLFKSAGQVTCKVLFCICENDSFTAPGSHKKIEKILGDKVTIIKNPIGHFDIYHGDYFKKSVEEQIEFIKRNLRS